MTTQDAAEVPAQVPPVQLKKDAGVLQLDVRVEVAPGLIDAGDAVRVQNRGGADVTVTVTLVVLPVPPVLLPLSV